MPYIKQERRDQLEQLLFEMVEAKLKHNGDTHFVLFSYAKHHIEPSYNNYKAYIGELEECASMIRSEMLVPYERIKKEENGDV